MHEARIAAVDPVNSWDYIDDFVVTFRNDSLQQAVFVFSENTSVGDSHNLIIRDDDMLSFINGRTFIVDSSYTNKCSSDLLFKIILNGTLSITVP